MAKKQKPTKEKAIEMVRENKIRIGTKGKRDTDKQKRWLIRYISNGGDATEAAIFAYGIDKRQAFQIGWINKNKIEKSKGYGYIMDLHGLTDEHLNARLLELTNAKKLLGNQKTGVTIEVDDNMTRLRAVELAQKLKGRGRDADNNATAAVQVNLTFHDSLKIDSDQ